METTQAICHAEGDEYNSGADVAIILQREIQGYMGHDQFAVGEGTFMRRFPIYLERDTNAAPNGLTRQIQYKLEPGEAGWILRPDRVVEF